MTRLITLVISLAVAAIGATSLLGSGTVWEPLLLLGGGVGIGIAAAGGRRPVAASRAIGGTEDRRVTGTVKWFNQAKGFGFIVPDDGQPDCFVHHSAIAGAGFRSLKQGQRVTLRVTRDERGRRTASEVSPSKG